MRIHIQEIGRKVTFYRQSKGLNQGELGKLAGLSQATISQIEQGRRKNLTFNSLYQIAEALGIEPGKLYPNTNPAEDVGSAFPGIHPSLHKALHKLASQKEEKQRKLGQVINHMIGLLE